MAAAAGTPLADNNNTNKYAALTCPPPPALVQQRERERGKNPTTRVNIEKENYVERKKKQ